MNVIIAQIFARYGSSMLEGSCGAVEDFARSLGATGAGLKEEPFAPGARVGVAVHGA